jgi:myo-inositol-1(or 4)-monophosphatase
MNQLRQDIQSFARQASDFLLKDFRKTQDNSRFSSKDAKSSWDKSSEFLIKNLIRGKYPDHSILAEESGHDKKDADFLWIIDPLDGTSNFVNCNPFFSVSLALQMKGKLALAAVHAPFLEESFFAEKDKGSFLNGKRIKVSSTDDIERSYIVTCEGGEKNKERTAKIRYTIVSKALDLRKLGSAALECAWVAAGRADGFVTTKISPWDVAAGILLVQEAGGKVTDFRGKPWRARQGDLVVSNGKVHERLLGMLRKQ